MKRRALRIFVFLLLGAIVNVAVSWGLLLWKPALLGAVDDGTPAVLIRFARDNGIDLESASTQCRGLGYRVVSLNHPDLTYIAAGLPIISVEGVSAWLPEQWQVDHGIEYPLHRLHIAYGIRSPSLGRNGFIQHLPVRPIWPGFAINTLFYAGILWLLFAAPFALRRRWRIKRGLCPKCAYPVGTNDVCTECGAAVKPKAVST